MRVLMGREGLLARPVDLNPFGNEKNQAAGAGELAAGAQNRAAGDQEQRQAAQDRPVQASDEDDDWEGHEGPGLRSSVEAAGRSTLMSRPDWSRSRASRALRSLAGRWPVSTK